MLRIFTLIILLNAVSAFSFAQSTAFTYQGRLTDSSTPASGTYDFEFAVFDAATGGTQVGSTQTVSDVSVVNGIFTVQLDFGAAAFPGASRFLEISIRPGSSTGGYQQLVPRQPITRTQYAIQALNADVATNSLNLGGQPPSAYGSTAQVTALQAQINQLQAELVATTGGTQLWSKGIGSTGVDEGASIAVDGSGDVFVTGTFAGTIFFGGETLTSLGAQDIFIVKYSGATGAHLWSARFGTLQSEGGSGLAVDSSGNVFLTGHFTGAIAFGGTGLNSAGGLDIFLVKFAGSNGAHLWSKRVGGTSDDLPGGLAVDGVGNVIVAGGFSGTANFGGTPLTSAGGGDIFVAKYNGTAGSHLWSKRFGGTFNDNGRGVATDSSGNVLVIGDFASASVDFGGGALTNAGGNDGYLAKYAAADGAHLWSKRFGGNDSEVSLGVAADGGGNVFVTGDFRSATIDMGGGPLTNTLATNPEIFIAKFNASGLHQWSKAVGGRSFDTPDDIAVDSSGDAVITGNCTGVSNFGGALLNGFGGNDVFAAKYAGSDGAHRWSRRLGGTGIDLGSSVALDPGGDVFLTGYFASTTADFGGGLLSNAGVHDIFVAKLKK